MRCAVAVGILALAVATYAGPPNCPSFLQNQTVCTCEEYVDGAIVKCSGKESPAVVESLKTNNVNVRELWLENARILEIGSMAFKSLRLKKLVLDNNSIKRLDKNAFKGLESTLQELSIASNRLQEIPGEAIDGLRALNVLNLKCNSIGNVTEPAFGSNPALIEVNLACNQICSLGDKVFSSIQSSLQNLILDNNCFTSVPASAIKNMTSLIALHMKNNQIAKLASKDFTDLRSLSMLTLTRNKIETVEANAVKNSPNIRYIYLNENKIGNIAAGSLKQFNSTEVLDLSYNELSEINEKTFGGLDSLQHLNLESNNIKEISPGAFSATPLLLLWLPYNCLTSLSPPMFQGVPFLKQISLAHNNIREIAPMTFAHLANMHTLDLTYNKIEKIENGALTGTDFMVIRLMENPFVCTQDGFHVLNGQEAINLTTEANLVCQADLIHDNTDQCPMRKNPPAQQPCCPRTAPKRDQPTPAPIEVPEIAETTIAPLLPLWSNAPPAPVLANVSPVPAPVPAVNVAVDSTTVSSAASAIAAARERARKLNMQRFWRLSRLPNNGVERPQTENTQEVVTTAVEEGNPHQRTQNYRTQLLPFLRNEEKNKSPAPQPSVEFSEDTEAQQVQVAEQQA